MAGHRSNSRKSRFLTRLDSAVDRLLSGKHSECLHCSTDQHYPWCLLCGLCKSWDVVSSNTTHSNGMGIDSMVQLEEQTWEK